VKFDPAKSASSAAILKSFPQKCVGEKWNMQPDPFDPVGQQSFEEYVRQWEKYFRVQK
jgi:hypothetical protein